MTLVAVAVVAELGRLLLAVQGRRRGVVLVDGVVVGGGVAADQAAGLRIAHAKHCTVGVHATVSSVCAALILLYHSRRSILKKVHCSPQ